MIKIIILILIIIIYIIYNKNVQSEKSSVSPIVIPKTANIPVVTPIVTPVVTSTNIPVVTQIYEVPEEIGYQSEPGLENIEDTYNIPNSR